MRHRSSEWQAKLCFFRRTVLAFACLFLAFSAGLAEAAEKRDRVALVIGNSRYDHLPSLANPFNDAKSMAAALWQAGFETIEVLDADRPQMVAAIATFAKRIGEGTDAVFFYAGHGVQSGGSNYLLPTTTRVEDAGQLRDHVIDANEIVGLMASSEARINVVILDACRDNPFADNINSLGTEIAEIDPALLKNAAGDNVVVRSAGGGLAPMQTGRAETVVGYSTGPGEVALDGDGDNSPYTWAILEHLDTPGLEIDMLFRRVRAEVREITSGKQVPWLASTLESEFYFRPLQEDTATTLEDALAIRDDDVRKLGLAPPSQLIEEAFWRVISSGGLKKDFEAYLQRYPEGRFVEEAQNIIQSLAEGDVVNRVDDDGAQIAYLGVGPVPVALPVDFSLPEEVLGLKVLSSPTSGMFFRRDQTRVMPDHLLGTTEMDGLRFLPRLGTSSVGVSEPLRLQPIAAGRGIEPWEHWVKSEIHPCDLLAGFRYAPDRVWDGVQQAVLNMDPGPAISACELAVQEYPESVRFAALLARANRAAQNWPEARKWAEIAVERNYAPGLAQLGTMLMRGSGTDPDYVSARDLFERAHELGNPAAALRIGEMYEGGLGVEADETEASLWYEKSIALGNAYAATRLARLYEAGRGVEESQERAVELYIGAAKAGELTATLRLARRLMAEADDEEAQSEALELLQAAAGTGIPEAQKALGQFYQRRAAEGSALDDAVYWYKKALDNGDLWAPLYLGELYLENEKYGVDDDEAVGLMQTSLERGNARAARRLAKLYKGDRLGGPDPLKALSYFRLSAEAGDIFSMRDLARALIKGDAGEANPDEGVVWMARSAEGGNPWAERDLGTSYAKGDVVERDPLKGALYLARAAGSGDGEAAKSAAERLEKLVDPKSRVLASQTWLNSLGFDVGVPDGVAGPKTRAAIAEFGAGLGLTSDIDPAAPELLSRLAGLIGPE